MLPRYQRVGGPVRSPHRLAATCQPTANGSRSGGVALLRQSRSALRRSELGHGHGQAIGARMHGSAPWKTEETIVGLPRLLVLSAFSRFGGCHLSRSDLVAVTFQTLSAPRYEQTQPGRRPPCKARHLFRSTFPPDLVVPGLVGRRNPTSGGCQAGEVVVDHVEDVCVCNDPPRKVRLSVPDVHDLSLDEQ